VYENPDRSRATTAAYEAVKEELATLYQEWEGLAEQLAAV
jgi:hypothetical protein